MAGRRSHAGDDRTIRQRLELFQRRCAQLRERRVVNGGIAFTFELAIDYQQKRFVPQFTGPDEEDFRAFMLDLRHFLAKEEPVYYERVVNDCYRSVDGTRPDTAEAAGMRAALQAARTSWRDIMAHQPYAAPTVDGVPVSAGTLLDLWINGDYFHNDDAKAAHLTELLATRGPLTRALLVRAVQSVVTNIVALDNIIQMGQNKGLFSFPDEQQAAGGV